MPSVNQPNKLLLRAPKAGANARLFCFPYSGLGASMYNKWPRYIGATELCLIQPPGRENRIREAHYGTYERLAEQVAEVLLPYLDRPFGFFGHCGGALPGFATALYLARSGFPTPDCLFVSSQVPPHEGPYGRFLKMTDGELAVELAKLTRALGGEPREDMIEMGLRVLRADVTANQKYSLEAPATLPCNVSVIGWQEDEEIRPEQMRGWSAYADRDRFHETVLPGAHHAFLSAPSALLAVFARHMGGAEHRPSEPSANREISDAIGAG